MDKKLFFMGVFLLMEFNMFSTLLVSYLTQDDFVTFVFAVVWGFVTGGFYGHISGKRA